MDRVSFDAGPYNVSAVIAASSPHGDAESVVHTIGTLRGVTTLNLSPSARAD
jgi:hypothetical protein